MDQFGFVIHAIQSKAEALGRIAEVATAISAVHGAALLAAVNASDQAERDRRLSDAVSILQSQMALAQIELWILNLP